MHKRSENNIFNRVLKFFPCGFTVDAGKVSKSILCMSLNLKKVLIFVSSLLVLLNTNVLNAATAADDVSKSVQPVQAKKTTTISMRLSTRKNRVYLDVKPAPVKIQFYSGKQRVGTLMGKKRMRFDVTGYATRAKKGQLRVVVYDKKGKQISRTLNVSPYIVRQPVRVPSKAQQQKQTAKDSKQHQMKESAIERDASQTRQTAESSNVLNATSAASDVRKSVQPVQAKKTTTISMRLSTRKNRVYLDVKPAPVKIQFYSGKQRLGTLMGKKRMRFDVTGYATKAKKGQLRVVVYDKKGKQTSRTLNVSRYLKGRTTTTQPATTSKSKHANKSSKQYQMIEPAIKRGMSHSADFDSSSKAIREFSKTKRLHQTLPQSDEKVRQKEQKDKIKESLSRKRVVLAKKKEQNKQGNHMSMAATGDNYYGGHMRYNKDPSIDSGGDDEPASLRAARGAALLMPYIDSARESTPYVLIEGNNFGNEAEGGVRMVRSNTAGNPVMNYFLEVVSWSDTEIFSRLPLSLIAELQQLRSPLSELSGSFTVGLYRQGRWLSNIVSIEEEPIDLDFDNDGHIAERFGGDDCDDEDANRYPGNPEVGDTEGHDEDCNPTTVGADRDGDGYVSDQYWNDHPTHPKRGTDCNDSSAEINPRAPESCNYVDDDCDGQVDEGLAQMAYQDNDGDRFGDPDSPPVQVCFPGPSLVFNNTDCDDTRADVHPGQMEICNGRDDNCDGVIDEGVTWTLYRDRDGDLHGDPAAPVEFCPRDEPPPGLVINNDDCDDTDAAINPLEGTCP